MEKTMKEKEKRELIKELARVINSLEGFYEFGAIGNGTKIGSWDLLYTLEDGQVETQKSISEKWQIPYSTVNTVTRQCVERGYVELKPIPGKRRDKQICMTPAGTAFAEETLGALYRAEEKAMDRVVEEYGPAFVEALDAYSRYLMESFSDAEEE